MSLKLEVIAEDNAGRMEEQFFDAWLSDGENTVAFLRGRFIPETVLTERGGIVREKGCWLYDIETREEYRNMGYSKIIRAMVSDHFSVPSIRHSGGFTPNGYAYLNKSLENERPYGASILTGPSFEAQDFVADWDAKTRA